MRASQQAGSSPNASRRCRRKEAALDREQFGLDLDMHLDDMHLDLDSDTNLDPDRRGRQTQEGNRQQ